MAEVKWKGVSPLPCEKLDVCQGKHGGFTDIGDTDVLLVLST